MLNKRNQLNDVMATAQASLAQIKAAPYVNEVQPCSEGSGSPSEIRWKTGFSAFKSLLSDAKPVLSSLNQKLTNYDQLMHLRQFISDEDNALKENLKPLLASKATIEVKSGFWFENLKWGRINGYFWGKTLNSCCRNQLDFECRQASDPNGLERYNGLER